MESVIVKTSNVSGVIWFRGAATSEGVSPGKERDCKVKGYVKKIEPSATSPAGVVASYLEAYIDNNIGIADEDLGQTNKDLSFQIVELVKGMYESLIARFDKSGEDFITLELKVLHQKIGKI